MAVNTGIWVLETFCAAHAGPCTSACSGCIGAGSVWKAAYQNYHSCNGFHLFIPGTSARELAAHSFCPDVLLNKCTTGSSSVAVISVKSTGPAVGSTSNSGCTHGTARFNRKIGCLNRSAMVFLGNGSKNKMWAHNYNP
jgi:hypothetical protein